jgi:hypothetical protein
VNFAAKNNNWDIRPEHAPQLFSIAPGSAAVAIPQFDTHGDTVWIHDSGAGTIRFVNGNAAVSGQIALTYWHYTSSFNQPVIVNRTDYTGNNNTILTPFDAAVYPIIEYIQANNRIYFNTTIPASADITVSYNRLFDSARMRATFTRVDPANESATPQLYGYTFLARDANGTSTPAWAYSEVVWGDLEVYSLGTTSQNNPGVGIIQGDVNSAQGLPTLTEFNWYRIVNAGSVTDTLRTNYDSSNGTTVFWDINGDRFIEPDGGVSAGLSYQIMTVDGANVITLAAGESVILGICNFLVPPNTPASIKPATVYSGQNADYLQTSDWLLTASHVSEQTSIASVVIN